MVTRLLHNSHPTPPSHPTGLNALPLPTADPSISANYFFLLVDAFGRVDDVGVFFESGEALLDVDHRDVELVHLLLQLRKRLSQVRQGRNVAVQPFQTLVDNNQ